MPPISSSFGDSHPSPPTSGTLMPRSRACTAIGAAASEFDEATSPMIAMTSLLEMSFVTAFAASSAFD